MRRGLDGAAQILEAGGARRVYSSHAGWVSYEPGRNGGRESLLEAADRCGWGAGQVTLGSFHLMGTARMGSSREDSVCDSDGEAWDVKGLYVVDGAVLPTGPGREPDGHDRGGGAQDRARDGGAAGVGPARHAGAGSSPSPARGPRSLRSDIGLGYRPQATDGDSTEGGHPRPQSPRRKLGGRLTRRRLVLLERASQGFVEGHRGDAEGLRAG